MIFKNTVVEAETYGDTVMTAAEAKAYKNMTVEVGAATRQWRQEHGGGDGCLQLTTAVEADCLLK